MFFFFVCVCVCVVRQATKAVDLQADESLKVNIADALNEQDVVKFTVHTKVRPAGRGRGREGVRAGALPAHATDSTLLVHRPRWTGSRSASSKVWRAPAVPPVVRVRPLTLLCACCSAVTRQHEEFVWLHDRYVENDDFAGIIIPPCPPKPDFSQVTITCQEALDVILLAYGAPACLLSPLPLVSASSFFLLFSMKSHGKLAKLQAGDASMPPEELEKLKQEIQGEYLAAFQKTVAMHEVFLLRVTSHPQLREDTNLQAFLEYDKDVSQ